MAAINFQHSAAFVILSFNEQGECVNEETETLQYPECFEQRYTVTWYVNNQQTYTMKNIRAGPAYDIAIPGEALMPTQNNRWHVMMRQHALQEISLLGVNGSDSVTICYEDQLDGYDNERIVVTLIM
jgi:hypothetical protein